MIYNINFQNPRTVRSLYMRAPPPSGMRCTFLQPLLIIYNANNIANPLFAPSVSQSLFLEFTFSNDGKFHFLATLPDTITTWVIQAVGISNLTGLGVARPLHVRTFKEFFVSLRLPYSVQRGEQASVIATVFNYAEFNLKVKTNKFLQTIA